MVRNVRRRKILRGKEKGNWEEFMEGKGENKGKFITVWNWKLEKDWKKKIIKGSGMRMKSC